MVYAFFDEFKKGRWQPDKILVSWDVSVYLVSQEVAVASFFLSLKDPGYGPVVRWPSSSPGGRLEKWLWCWLYGQWWSGVQMCPSLSVNHDENQNIELNKNPKYSKLLQKISLMCSWHFCSDK